MKEIIYSPKYLWDGETDRVKEQSTLVVQDGKVTYTGLLEEALALYPKGEVCHKDNWLIMPALIDAHDHGRAVSPVGYSVPDRCLEMWLPDLGKIPAVPHSIAAYYDGLNLASSGVTTVLHSHNPNNWEHLEDELVDAANGYNEAGVKCILCPPFIDQNKGIYDNRQEFIDSLPKESRENFVNQLCDQIFTIEEYLELITRLRRRLGTQIDNGMAEIQLHPNGGQWCSDGALLKMKEYALENQMRIHMHLLETKYQAVYAKRKWAGSFMKHYQEIGFLGPWVSFAHAVWLSDEDICLLARSGARVVANPSSNLRLKSGIIPLKSLTEAGVTVGLGLDGCGFDDDQDFLREMRAAWFNMEVTGVDGGIDKMIPLKMATVNGAAICGSELSSGILKEGVCADFIGINIEQLRRPYADHSMDILELLVQRGTRKVVDSVFVNGNMIYSSQKETYHKRILEAEQILTDAIRQLRKDSDELPDKQELIQAVHDFYKDWEGLE